VSDWLVSLDRVGADSWLGWLKPAGARRACAVVCLSDEQVEELEIDTRPLEWLLAQAAPPGTIIL
jgi:hypothetical protein